MLCMSFDSLKAVFLELYLYNNVTFACNVHIHWLSCPRSIKGTCLSFYMPPGASRNHFDWGGGGGGGGGWCSLNCPNMPFL